MEPAQGSSPLSSDYLDKLLAPVALYPDQLLAQMLLCSSDPRKVGELSAWLKQMSALKGSELQKAAEAIRRQRERRDKLEELLDALVPAR